MLSIIIQKTVCWMFLPSKFRIRKYLISKFQGFSNIVQTYLNSLFLTVQFGINGLAAKLLFIKTGINKHYIKKK